MSRQALRRLRELLQRRCGGVGDDADLPRHRIFSCKGARSAGLAIGRTLERTAEQLQARSAPALASAAAQLLAAAQEAAPDHQDLSVRLPPPPAWSASAERPLSCTSSGLHGNAPSSARADRRVRTVARLCCTWHRSALTLPSV